MAVGERNANLDFIGLRGFVSSDGDYFMNPNDVKD